MKGGYEKLSQIYFEIAKKDLRAAKLLYDQGFYPQAIFYLEQAVEKAVKAVILMYNIHLSSEELYSHRLVSAVINRYHTKITQVINNLEKLNAVLDEFSSKRGAPPTQFVKETLKRYRGYTRYMDILNNIRQIKEDLQAIVDLEKNICSKIDEIKRVVNKKKISRSILQSLKGGIQKLFYQRWRNLFNLQQSGIFTLPVLRLGLVGFILEKFVTISRYHDPRDSYGPESFTNENPIVQIWLLIYENIEGAFSELDKLFYKDSDKYLRSSTQL
ncbi:MAG: HEPN domain-containing protein [Thermoproteota archaeon]